MCVISSSDAVVDEDMDAAVLVAVEDVRATKTTSNFLLLRSFPMTIWWP